MSLDPPRSRPAPDSPEDDTLIVDGLERAVLQARTKIPDHENHIDIVLPSPTSHLDLDGAPAESVVEVEAPFDSSAVMEVLRGAIARYTTGDAHEHGAWVDEFPRSESNGTDTLAPRHAAAAAGYAPDRRRLAAVVVVLFLLVGGFGYQQLSSGGTESVKTEPRPTVAGRGVTTLTRPVPSVVVTAAPATPPPDTAAVPSVTKGPTPTTVHHPRTTSPPSTDPPTTQDTTPTTQATTTTEATTTTTQPVTTTT
jgi:hypothetical protein